jgi:hypothetical protein
MANEKSKPAKGSKQQDKSKLARPSELGEDDLRSVTGGMIPIGGTTTKPTDPPACISQP